jgi:hypothetical protein
MPDPWEKGVQQTHRLTVFATPAFLRSPVWGRRIFDDLINEFNRLAAANLLGVRMEQSQTAPDPAGPGANVSMDISHGPCAFFDEHGKPTTGFLDVASGPKARGKCFSVALTDSFTRLIRAFIFLPANPQMDLGRTVGPRVLKALAFHELLHACGLHNEDPGHGSDDAPAQGDLDVFVFGGVVQPGSRPENDVMLAGGKITPNLAGQFFLTPRTVGLIQSIWLLGQF